MLGLIAGPAAVKGTDASAVPDAASEFNKLVQTGTASLTTKTAGTFGQGEVPSISAGINGNGHPAVVVPMFKGEIGVNHVAAKERLIFVTGPPIEPHHGISQALDLPAEFSPWLWPKLLQCMVSGLGLPNGSEDHRQATRLFGAASVDVEEELDSKYKPNQDGYPVELVDGTQTRLRFERHEHETGYYWQPQLRVANRDIPIPEGEDLDAMTQRVVSYFEQPHVVVEMTQDARLAHKGFCLVFDSNCAVARDDGRIIDAARLGAAPWHLAMLSASLLVIELAAGEFQGHAGLAQRELRIEEHHVVRAFNLLVLVHKIGDCWQGNLPQIDEEAQAKSQAAAVALASMPPNLPRGGAAEWLPTQQRPEFAATVHAEPDELYGPGVPFTETQERKEESSTPSILAGGQFLTPGDVEIPSCSTGYGPAGISVQNPEIATTILTDRQVMLRTLLRGELVVFGCDVCDATAQSSKDPSTGKRKRSSLSKMHWEAVVRAAMTQYNIGSFSDGAGEEHRAGQARLTIQLPAQSNEEAKRLYHNRLMMLCGLSLSRFSDAIAKKAERTTGSKPKMRRPSEAADAADEHVREGEHLNEAAAARPRPSAAPSSHTGGSESELRTAAPTTRIAQPAGAASSRRRPFGE